MAITDDAIREIHGCRCRDNNTGGSPASISLTEKDDGVVLRYDGSFGAVMTPWQARYVAAKLYRIARRVNARHAAGDPA